MEIAEIYNTKHEGLNIHWKGTDGKLHEKWVDIHKDEKGELLSVTIGSKEITAFELDLITFLKEKGKL